MGQIEYEIRRLKKNELPAAVQLADHVFRDEDHQSMGVSFPLIFNPGTIHSFGAFDGDRLVSFMGLVPSVIKIQQARVDIFSLGSVCTHEDYRKQGISSRMLEHVYKYIDKVEASILLVSGDRGLYRRNHCHHFGKVNSYIINQPCEVAAAYQGHLREYKDTDLFQLDRLRDQKQVRYEASISEWSSLFLAHSFTSNLKMNPTIFIAENDEGIECYLVVGVPNEKSLIQHGIVLEWAGEKSTIHSLLNYIRETLNLSHIEFKVPYFENFDDVLAAYPSEIKADAMTLHVIDPMRLIKQVASSLVTKDISLVEHLNIEKINNDTYKLTLNDIELDLNSEELTTLLFGFDVSLQTGELASLFPISLPFMEGLFSI